MRGYLAFFALLLPLEAANWLMLQGTQAKAEHRLWGFVQVLGEKNYGDLVEKEGRDVTAFSRIVPTLETQEALQVQRLRIGARGALDGANLWNYFLLTELGNNGITNPLGQKEHNYLTDASITAKHLPVFIRAGRFKYPGSEEGFLTRFADPFVRFTTVTDQLMLERFVTAGTSLPAQGVGAFRDSGVELFQTWQLSPEYGFSAAYMVGAGSGLANEMLHQDTPTHYGYVAYEHAYGEKKGYAQLGHKVYAWGHTGKRLLEGTLYERTRYGVGSTWTMPRLRLEAELLAGKGMIFTGAKDVDAQAGKELWQWSMAPQADNRAWGGYVAMQAAMTSSYKLLARYDTYHRLYDNAAAYRAFNTTTVGLSYGTGMHRVDVNYAFRNISAPKNATADALFDAVGDILSVQYTMVIR